jgi:hypothetical protein
VFLAGENNGIAFADSPAGPFKAVANLTWAGGPPPSAAAAAVETTGGGAGSVLELKRRERCGKRAYLRCLYTKNDLFAKTCSGHT